MKNGDFNGFPLLGEGFGQKWWNIGQGRGGFLRIFLGFMRFLSEKWSKIGVFIEKVGFYQKIGFSWDFKQEIRKKKETV